MPSSPSDLASFAKRVAVVLGLATLFVVTIALFWQATIVLLLFFAGLLFMLLLDTCARWLAEHLPLSRRWGLLIVVVLLLVGLGGCGWLTAPRITDQFGQLQERIPQAVGQIEQRLAEYGLAEYVPAETMLEMSRGDSAQEADTTHTQLAAPPDSAASGRDSLAASGRDSLAASRRDTVVYYTDSSSESASGTGSGGLSGSSGGAVSSVMQLLSRTLRALSYAFVVIVVGLYLAYEPRPYFDGAVRLAPKPRRARIREVLHAIGHALRWWLGGRLMSMAVVGILTAIGLMILGVPLAFLLAVIAGVLSFIPFLGPIFGFIPAALIALTQDPALVPQVGLVFIIVQLLESHAITPIIQRRATSLLPAILVAVQVFFGVLAGILGVLLAAPITVAVTVAVQMLYVEDVLGDDVEVLGA